MANYERLAIRNLDEFLYGISPKPLTVGHGLTIGGGMTYPELNFSLPPMSITAETMPEVLDIYRDIIKGACERSVDLNVPGLVVEFEALPPMTLNPDWATEITGVLRDTLDEFHGRYGFASALRVTPNDTREHERPPLMRQGHLWDEMLRTFDQCAARGADLLAIESNGGKEVSDTSILNADLLGTVFALGVMGARDMYNLWSNIAAIAERHGKIAAGDTACGFGNTAMVLAEKKYIPRVWASVVRVLTVPRTLVAYETGAKGPSKDCAYEGPFIKAITGYPISMEGADAACAHLSPVGNIARAVCDLWSNESIQHIKLLGAMAPMVSLEQLTYSTRLMNTAAEEGLDSVRTLRDWFVKSDSYLDPQAYILRPDVVLEVSARIMEEETPYRRTRAGAFAALDIIRRAHETGECKLPPQELKWLDILSIQAEELPDTEEELIEKVMPTLDKSVFRPGEYGL